MLASKIVWSMWALIPVGGLAFHFGPGQRAYVEDKARDIVTQAGRLEDTAQAAQDAAYEKHLASLKARRAAMVSKTPEDAATAKTAADQEDAAYHAASDAWQAAADKLHQAQDMLAASGSDKVPPIRIARDRALVRAGKIAEGVGDLETMLDALADDGQAESDTARKAREELATGYYYGARLMRIAGRPQSDWRAVSGWSRQNFRYLAETSGSPDAPKAAEFQKNLELVLNLEQSAQEDLMARPLPKNSPRCNCEGLKPGQKQGKSKRPPRKGPDARGAGGVGDIDGGW